MDKMKVEAEKAAKEQDLALKRRKSFAGLQHPGDIDQERSARSEPLPSHPPFVS